MDIFRGRGEKAPWPPGKIGPSFFSKIKSTVKQKFTFFIYTYDI
jgi:hypothetical protein